MPSHTTTRQPSRLRRLLPQGSSLPTDVWWQRHRGILVLLWLHVPAVAAMALVQDPSVWHAALEGGVVTSLAVLALAARRHPTLSTVIASVGLMTCSAELVHLSDGLIETHFHFFVMVGVVTLYQQWPPFLVAIGYVIAHHGIAGAVAPESVYNHPAAIASPWTWAAIHGGFILAMSVTGIITWKLNELLLLATRDREQKLAEAQQLARLGSWEFRSDSGATMWSAEMRRLMGVEPGFVPTIESMAGLVHPDDLPAWQAEVGRVIRGEKPLDLDIRVVLPDGGSRWLHARGMVTEWDGDEPAVMAGTAQDITQRKRAEDALRASEARLGDTLSLLNATLESTADGILVVDVAGTITSYNGKFVEMWDIPQDILDRGDDGAAIECVLDKLRDPDGFLAKVTELYAQPAAESYDTLAFRDGRMVERLSRPQRIDGAIVGRVWSFRDVTDRTRLETELTHQAFHDSLTGLANQALFRDRLDHALARARDDDAPQLAVIFLDLDNFKHVNDSLGHTAGDEVLREVTARLQKCLRPADTAARLGGDEFAILVEDLDDPADVTPVAERILRALRRPYVVAGKEVFAAASLGLAVSGDGVSGDQLLRNADLAMYNAKRLGKNRVERFEAAMHTAAMERVELEADLRRAGTHDELRLQYQPIASLATGELLSVEALVRWQHPSRGLLGPDEFVSFAEEAGVIDGIGNWVLERACSQAREWHRKRPDRRPVGVSVNVSPFQLRDRQMPSRVASILERTGLEPECLTLEITESAMIDDTDRALAQLNDLRALGVRLAVDDFGTGYSSLSYLQRFPVDVLKIDRSFVDRIEHGPEESALARAIVRLAQSLQLTAVAEGVETEGQLAWLRDVGCAWAQGYLLSEPVDATAIDVMLDEVAPFGCLAQAVAV